MNETGFTVDENKKAEISAKAQKDWTMLTHLSGLISFFGIPGIIGPLIAWLIKKDDMPRVDFAGKEAINFHLTMLIVAAISGALTVIFIGFIGLFLVLDFLNHLSDRRCDEGKQRGRLHISLHLAIDQLVPFFDFLDRLL